MFESKSFECEGCGRKSEVRIKKCQCGWSVAAKAASLRNGPGSQLLRIIPSRFKKAGCGCQAYALRMDWWGVEGCQERKEEIISHITSKKPSQVPVGLARMVASRWLTKAIDRAKRFAQKTGPG